MSMTLAESREPGSFQFAKLNPSGSLMKPESTHIDDPQNVDSKVGSAFPAPVVSSPRRDDSSAAEQALRERPTTHTPTSQAWATPWRDSFMRLHLVMSRLEDL
jgi:hypothetical protein